MEGRGGFGYGHLAKNPHLLRTTPPLKAIERFLWSPNNPSQTQVERSVDGLVSANGFREFSSSVGAIDGYGSGVLWPSLQETNFVDGLLVDGESLNWTHERNHKMGFRGEVKLGDEKNTAGWVGKRVKGGSSATSIKGQWTEEEDSLLVRLVKQYGVRKWAQISQKLVGRAGKQCRERWHNHLRPDIKKDTWSVEEERMLVEAHEKIGNRWAAIAKRIPGRTENSIKNHWNATKRRQNSRRKNKKAVSQGGKSQPSILQDYIRSKSMKDDTSTTITTTTTTTGSTLSSALSNQLGILLPELSEPTLTGDSPTSIANTYDDELLSIQKFFANIYEWPSNDATVVGSTDDETIHDEHLQFPLSFDLLDLFQTSDDQKFMEMDEYGLSSNTPIEKMSVNNLQKQDSNTPHLSSDLYLSYLLNGPTYSPSTDNHYENPNIELLTDQASSNGKREMDLLEMVSSSQFSQSSNNSFCW
ncbi:hypothetical protein HHK36_016232 [Tetracentron sinense]|uniref:Uncharacterized protein n=1 Tax=Tetracentron sinense TaxID=13715 RepID=A0A834YWT5_TETSI|nr:hypothetical protein HHK36_016232 [Tetracentron sinense]